MASRDPKHMHVELYAIYREFDKELKKAGIDHILTCTYRSDIEQAALYSQGRTAPGKIVTNADAGQSPHNICAANYPCAMAFDIAIMKCGKIDWDTKNPDWKRAGEIGKKLGLTWGGNFKKVDMPHFELKNWKEIANV